MSEICENEKRFTVLKIASNRTDLNVGIHFSFEKCLKISMLFFLFFVRAKHYIIFFGVGRKSSCGVTLMDIQATCSPLGDRKGEGILIKKYS